VQATGFQNIDELPGKIDVQDNSHPQPTRQARWQAANPKARWAHLALASALRRGLIEKGTCEVCGAAEVDGHHPDYDRPMAVRWFCRRHHVAEHRRLRQNGGAG
jgi:hypothetical protein